MFNSPKKKSQDVETPTEDVKKTKKEWKGSTYFNLLPLMKSKTSFKLGSHSVDDVKSNVPETKPEELDTEKETKKISPDFAKKK